MASYIFIPGRNVCGIWQRLVLLLVLPLLHACVDDASPDPEDPDPAYNEEAEDEPQPIGQATIMYAADQKTLDVYGCDVRSHYLRQGEAPEGVAYIHIHAVTQGASVLTADPSASYELQLKILQKPSGQTATLMTGSNNDESWSLLTQAFSPDEIELVKASSGRIRIDDAPLDLTTGATEHMTPRPGLANSANPGTGQFDIEVTTVARPALEAPLAPFHVIVDAACEITWMTD